MSASFDFEAPDHFTAGSIGPPGQRVFYLQGRESGSLVTLRIEKEQVRGLAEYLADLLAKLPPGADEVPGDPGLLEPVDAAWVVGSLAVGYDKGQDRILVAASELVEEDSGEEPAAARFRLARAQVAAFVDRVRALVKAGRPICTMCGQPKDPAGHACPRSNGHLAARA